MREGHPSTTIKPAMLPFIEGGARASALRFLSVVAAVLAVLITSVVAAGETSANATSSSTTSTSSYDSEELQFLELLNLYREDNGVGPLILSDTLALAAQRHSQDMARYAFFAHTTLESSYYAAGSAPWDRMAAEGYDYNSSFKGENIAVGCQSAPKCFELWRNSPSHNAAML